MYKKDTLNRYQLFFNEAIELAKEGQLKNLSELRVKYGVSGGLLSFMKAKNILSMNGSGKVHTYTTTLKNPINVAETQMLISDFNRWKRNGITSVMEPSGKTAIVRKTPKKGSCLTDSTTRELIAELKRRGYTGTLTIQKEIVL